MREEHASRLELPLGELGDGDAGPAGQREEAALGVAHRELQRVRVRVQVGGGCVGRKRREGEK